MSQASHPAHFCHMVGMLAVLFAMEASAREINSWEPGEPHPWFRWLYDDTLQLKPDGESVIGWTSFRAMNQELGISANVVPADTHAQVGCYIKYYVVDDEGERFAATRTTAQFLGVYPGLLEALRECRKSIENHVGLEPAPIYDPADGSKGTDLAALIKTNRKPTW